MALQSDPRRPALRKIIGILAVGFALSRVSPAQAAERQAVSPLIKAVPHEISNYDNLRGRLEIHPHRGTMAGLCIGTRETGVTMGYLTDLTDAQWAFIEPLIPVQEGPGRPREVDLRRVLDALMYQDRTGCQWRMIPRDFPPSGTVRYYFDKWNEDGTMLEIHDQLRRQVREQQGRESEPTAIVIDSQSVKTTEAGGERGFDGGKQVKGRKRQMVVDTEGNLLTVAVHAAGISDQRGAEPVLNETQELCPTVSYAWADQSYRGELVEWAASELGITIEIVMRPADQVGFQVQPRRWVVERTIAWLNRCRRLSKDFERLAKNSAAWIYWASIQRMLRYLAPSPDQERPYIRKMAVFGTR